MILDASVVLAAFFDEPGAEWLLEGTPATMSAVNWCEVAAKSQNPGWMQELVTMGISVAPFGQDDAEEAAALATEGNARGLSVGDRACLALAKLRGEPVLTADRAWADFPGVDVRLIR